MVLVMSSHNLFAISNFIKVSVASNVWQTQPGMGCVEGSNKKFSGQSMLQLFKRDSFMCHALQSLCLHDTSSIMYNTKFGVLGDYVNSSICKFWKANGTVGFGSIHCFCLCAQVPIAIIAIFSSVKDAFEDIHPASVRELNKNLLTNSCIFKAEKLSVPYNFVAICVSSIIVKCVHVPSQCFDYM